MSTIRRRNLDQPDEVRSFPKMTGHLVDVGSVVIGRAVLDPGWRWSTHVSPVAGTPTCQVHHVQLVLRGRMALQVDGEDEVVELAPGDVADVPRGHDAWVLGDEPVVVLDLLGNVADIGLPREHQRVVTTILMSDIVDSTSTAHRLGDAAWKQLLADHDRLIRSRLERFGGHEVKTTGDGFVVTFPSAIGALRSAAAIRDGVSANGLQVRIGVHTGEVELVPNDIHGVTVHAAARIMALAGAGEILASSVTRDLVDGSGLRLAAAGAHRVKGFDRPVEVFRLEG
jgi:class 3 adenylate cyclase